MSLLKIRGFETKLKLQKNKKTLKLKMKYASLRTIDVGYKSYKSTEPVFGVIAMSLSVIYYI